jgi:hypothetical protein
MLLWLVIVANLLAGWLGSRLGYLIWRDYGAGTIPIDMVMRTLPYAVAVVLIDVFYFFYVRPERREVPRKSVIRS